MLACSGIYGHDLIRKRLFAGARENRLFNSYIFEGAKGSGRKTLAKEFCASVMCKNKEGKLPCGECDACRKVFSHNHPDILYVEKEKGKKTIGVDTIRDNVINNIYVKPLIADRKIVVILDGECLTEQSQNALLKVLEEPPEYVSFIIITESAGMLLKTVLSRSVVFSLMPIKEELVLKILEERTGDRFSESERKIAAKFAQGIPGKGLEILESEEFSRLYKETAGHFFSLFNKKSAVTGFEKYLTDEKENIDIIINFMLIFLRDCMLIKLGSEKLVISQNYAYDLGKYAIKLTEKKLAKACELVLAYQERLRRNAGFLASTMDMLLKLSGEISA